MPSAQKRAGLGLVVHCWFVTNEPSGCHRFEVWQHPKVRGKCFGHVHVDLMTPETNVGGGPSQVVKTWCGDEAVKIQNILSNIEEYPYCYTYRYWPGPNSNTFVAWVLKKAKIKHKLSTKALGRWYPA